MADETDRKMSLKKMKDPNDDSNFFKFPSIDQVQFKDFKTKSQEFVFRFNNTDKSSRKTHTKTVKNPNDDSSTVDVERVETIFVKDPKTKSQEFGYRFKNNDPPPQTADSNIPKHLKTHVVRYTADNTPDGIPWGDFEIIDEISFLDHKTNSQESIFRLKKEVIGDPIDDPDDPFNPTLAIVDFSLPDAPENTETDPPYRYDPFKNLVNVNWGKPLFFFFHSGQTSPDTDTNVPVIGTYRQLAGGNLSGTWIAQSTFDGTFIGEPPGFQDGPSPPFNPSPAQQAVADVSSRSCMGGGILYAATLTILKAVKDDGTVLWSTNISSVTRSVPNNPPFFLGTDAGGSHANDGDAQLLDIQYAGGAVHLALFWVGRSISDPLTESGVDSNFGVLQAAGYLSVKTDGTIKAHETFQGPQATFSYTDENTEEHFLKEAHDPTLNFGKFG